MKLVRYRSATGEKPGLILDGAIFDLSGSFSSLNPRAPTLDDIEAIAAIPAKALSKAPKDVVLGPPLRGIGKIIGVGLNYRDHAEETGLPLPKEPTLFLKATNALCGPTTIELEIAFGEVDADAIAKHMVKRITLTDVDAGLPNHDGKLDLPVDTSCLARHDKIVGWSA